MAPEGGRAPLPAWRRVTSATLLVVGSVLGVASIGTLFVRTELLSTRRYVATVEPLADSTPVRHALANFVVAEIYQHVNVVQVAQEALPPQGQFLAAPLSVGIRSFSGQVVERLLASSQFRSLWSTANRVAHQQLVALLRDTSRRVGPVTLRNGTVTVDLSKTIEMARQQLVRAGLTFVAKVHVPAPRAQYRLIDSMLLARGRRYVAVLNALTWALPFLMLAAFAGAVAVSEDRRRALVRVGVAFAAGMAAVIVLLAAGRSLYLHAATGPQVPRDAAGAVFDTLLRYLRTGAYLGVAIGSVVAAGAWVAGPSAAAVRARRLVVTAFQGVRREAVARGWAPGPVAAYTARHRTALRVGAAAAVFVLLVIWGQPTLRVVIGLLVVLGVLLVAIEFVARVGSAPRPGGAAPTR